MIPAKSNAQQSEPQWEDLLAPLSQYSLQLNIYLLFIYLLQPPFMVVSVISNAVLLYRVTSGGFGVVPWVPWNPPPPLGLDLLLGKY